MSYRFSLFTTVLTFIVLILGVLVVATEAGDACGHDWPFCNGKLYPDITDPLQVIEYTHRLVTGALGFVILFNAILAVIKRPPGDKVVLFLAPLTLLLLLAQAFAGGLNVLLKTPPGFTTIDVALSLALFSSIVFLTVALHRKEVVEINEENRFTNQRQRKMFKPTLSMMLLFYALTILGAFFKHSAASQIVLGLTNKDRLFESQLLSEFLYVFHGVLGVSVVVMIVRVIVISLRERVMVGATILLCILVVLEALIGFVTFATKLDVFSGSIHTLMASAIMGVGSYVLAKALIGNTVVVSSEQRS